MFGQKIMVATCFIVASVASVSKSADSKFAYVALSPESTLVPQNLLKLVHTPEVQTELGISSENEAAFEDILRDIDSAWWPARILPADKQRQAISDLEIKLSQNVERLLGGEAVIRLRQIELQSQSIRILSRPEVAKFIALDPKQTKRILEIFLETDQLEKAASDKAKAKANTETRKEFENAQASESKRVFALLSPNQIQRLPTLLGKPFDTKSLERVYPLAPELIDTGSQFGARPTLSSLKGKVVLVHFYAFQCHNCVANFQHYNRWDSTWKSKGVEVVGIQTPELPEERDPRKVILAATKEGFGFPVLIDLKNDNWNAWGNTMWPTVYVIDKKGYIRFWWQGELNWQGATGDKTIESLIEKLLNE